MRNVHMQMALKIKIEGLKKLIEDYFGVTVGIGVALYNSVVNKKIDKLKMTKKEIEKLNQCEY